MLRARASTSWVYPAYLVFYFACTSSAQIVPDFRIALICFTVQILGLYFRYI